MEKAPERPLVAYVFGVFSLIFGGIGAWLGLLAGEIYVSQLQSRPISGFLGLLGILINIVESYSGILLILNNRNALKLTTVYVSSAIALASLNAVAEILAGQWSHITATLIAGLISLTYRNRLTNHGRVNAMRQQAAHFFLALA